MARVAEELRVAEQIILFAPRIAATRIYFAVFHAVRALLYAEGYEPRSHQGAIHLFNLHFVRTARFEAGTSRLLARLQKFREEADYNEVFVIDPSGAREELEAARGFTLRVQEELKKQGLP